LPRARRRRAGRVARREGEEGRERREPDESGREESRVLPANARGDDEDEDEGIAAGERAAARRSLDGEGAGAAVLARRDVVPVEEVRGRRGDRADDGSWERDQLEGSHEEGDRGHRQDDGSLPVDGGPLPQHLDRGEEAAAHGQERPCSRGFSSELEGHCRQHDDESGREGEVHATEVYNPRRLRA